MTVSELIEKLKVYPPDMRVMVRGYEWGLEDLSEILIRVSDVRLDVDSGQSYGGPHEEVEGWEAVAPDCQAVLFDRDS